MANSPPLPAGAPAGPAAATFQFPPGTRLNTPLPPLTPELSAALDAARRSGGFYVTITMLDPVDGDSERLTTKGVMVGNFKRDWLLRTWQTISKIIWTWGMDRAIFDVPQAPPTPPSESREAAG